MVISTNYNRYLNNPAYNPELALQQKAESLAAQYSGHLPGGRASPYLAQILKRTLEGSYLVTNPLTQEKHSFPGLDVNLGESIFTAIYNKNLNPRLQLAVLQRQREALQAKEVEAAEQRQRLFRLRYGPAVEPRDRQSEVDSFLKKYFPEQFPDKKDLSTLTPLPSYYDVLPTSDTAFDNDGDGVFDFQSVPVDDSLSIPVADQVAVNGDVLVSDIFAKSVPADATHVAVRLSGEQFLDVDPRYLQLDPYIPALKQGTGVLESGGSELDKDRYHVLTLNEWNTLRYRLESDGEKERVPDFLSVIALHDTDGGGLFTDQDRRSGVQSVLILPSADVVTAFQDGPAEADRHETLLRFGGLINTLDLHFDSNTADIVSLLQQGDIEIIVTERGRDPLSFPAAVFDASSSSGQRLRFTFDQSARDGINVAVYRHDSALDVKNINLSTYQ